MLCELCGKVILGKNGVAGLVARVAVALEYIGVVLALSDHGRVFCRPHQASEEAFQPSLGRGKGKP